ncbi:MAG: DUF1566 domain-containing protein [Paraprevotella sp.]|nr:DUF1566 domain-containing protein [Paraprevotella sp.]
MKNYLLTILSLVCCICCISCNDSSDDSQLGGIYGIITIKETAEPMRATGVELYNGYNALLLKTVTYDDGHYEFEKLSPGQYYLKVEATGYSKKSYRVLVESGRTARADMQLEKPYTEMTVNTLEVTEQGEEVTFNATYAYNSSYPPQECGFYYSTSTNPEFGGIQIKGTKKSDYSSFFATINEIKKGIYYVKAYAKNSLGIEFGNAHKFEVRKQPVISTLPATNVKDNRATLNGIIEYEGEPSYTEKGFVYSKYFQNPTIEDPSSSTTKIAVSGGSKEFSANIADLTRNTTYFARTYAIHETDIIYGNTINFSEADYIILSTAGIMIQKYDLNSGTDWETASQLCSSSNLGGYTDWRLPTRGECKAIYQTLQQGSQLNIDTNQSYWTADYYYSSYYYRYYYYYINYKNGSIDNTTKDASLRVRAVRTL